MDKMTKIEEWEALTAWSEQDLIDHGVAGEDVEEFLQACGDKLLESMISSCSGIIRDYVICWYEEQKKHTDLMSKALV